MDIIFPVIFRGMHIDEKLSTISAHLWTYMDVKRNDTL